MGIQMEGPQNFSEDCLYLNIWTPIAHSDQPTRKRPVYVWIHGGWFQLGDARQDVPQDPVELVAPEESRAEVSDAKGMPVLSILEENSQRSLPE